MIDIEKDLKRISDFARAAHDAANCKYNGKNYYTHIKMVEDGIDKYNTVFMLYKDYLTARTASSLHDTIEDTPLNFNDIKLSFNDIKVISIKRVAQVVLAVTDIQDENRLLRHLSTMNKTVKDYIAIIVKMADMRANGKYSKENGSSMYKKYVAEYEYRRPIFKMALKWYDKHFDQEILNEFWTELDEIHGYKHKCLCG